MRYVLWGFIFWLLLFSSVGAKRLVVVASLFPLYEMAQEVGDKKAEVHLLLPPGADPHSWEPTPKDLLRLRKADLLFAVGAGLEPWLEDLLAGLSPKNILLATQGAPLLEGHHQGVDPHIWLDFTWDATLSQRLGEKLSRLDPSQARFFRQQAQELARRFQELHQRYLKTLSHCKQKTLVIAGHAAFGYWERLYGLKMISLAGLSPEAEPTPKAIQKAVQIIRQKGLQAVFYEEPSSRKFAELIARETGVDIYYLTPGASPTLEELSQGLSFFDLMERNLRNLRLGLGCKAN